MEQMTTEVPPVPHFVSPLADIEWAAQRLCPTWAIQTDSARERVLTTLLAAQMRKRTPEWAAAEIPTHLTGGPVVAQITAWMSGRTMPMSPAVFAGTLVPHWTACTSGTVYSTLSALQAVLDGTATPLEAAGRLGLLHLVGADCPERIEAWRLEHVAPVAGRPASDFAVSK